jgi:hypothetical protein
VLAPLRETLAEVAHARRPTTQARVLISIWVIATGTAATTARRSP